MENIKYYEVEFGKRTDETDHQQQKTKEKNYYEIYQLS